MKLLRFFSLFFFCSLLLACDAPKPKSIAKPTKKTFQVSTPKKEKIEELKEFLKNKNYNQNIAFLIDFKIPSNRNRMFVYDLKNDKVLEKDLVSHGEGSDLGNGNLQFSNVENSYCSSLGKYKVGYSYEGQFGKAYKLMGLEASNSNAFKRAVVLHQYKCVPDTEQEQPICFSLGCPMVSQKFFNILEKYIDSSKKPIILMAYY